MVNTFPNPFNYYVNVLFKLALPDHDYFPSDFSQFLYFFFVPFFIPLEFFTPEFLVDFGKGRVTRGATMPETAMNKNSKFFPRISYIRPTGDFWPMKPITRQA